MFIIIFTKNKIFCFYHLFAKVLLNKKIIKTTSIFIFKWCYLFFSKKKKAYLDLHILFINGVYC